MREALFYQQAGDGHLRCRLCPHSCTLAPNQTGRCQGRQHLAGQLYATNYAQSATRPSLDPIEKKPLYHFRPGSQILSVGPNGCNLQCSFCQNWQISQQKVATIPLSPQKLRELTRPHRAVAFTYAEPLIWYEYIWDFAKLTAGDDIAIALVSNGFIRPKPWKQLLPHITVANFDLKSFSEGFYRDYCGGSLKAVQETIATAAAAIPIEITMLLIPELNSDRKQFAQLCSWIAQNCGRKTPLHISRYFPSYQQNQPPTPKPLLAEFYQIATQVLDFVYLGNTSGHSDTHCHHCKALLVRRQGYATEPIGLQNGHCKSCGKNNNFHY